MSRYSPRSGHVDERRKRAPGGFLLAAVLTAAVDRVQEPTAQEIRPRHGFGTIKGWTDGAQPSPDTCPPHEGASGSAQVD